jgi:hypothetical protein
MNKVQRVSERAAYAETLHSSCGDETSIRLTGDRRRLFLRFQRRAVLDQSDERDGVEKLPSTFDVLEGRLTVWETSVAKKTKKRIVRRGLHEGRRERTSCTFNGKNGSR